CANILFRKRRHATFTACGSRTAKSTVSAPLRRGVRRRSASLSRPHLTEDRGMPVAIIDGRKMYYEVHGEGEPVLAIGGFPLSTGHGFANQPARLREQFRVIVFDHRGLGQSEDDDSPPSTALYAHDAAGLLDGLGVK